MPPKKRGTRASKRKAEEEAAAEQQSEESMDEGSEKVVSDEKQDDDEEPMDQEQAVSRSEEEQEETMDQEPEATEQPPEKKAKVNEAGEDDNEDEATPEPEETPEERGERIRMNEERKERERKEKEEKRKKEEEEKLKAEMQKELDKFWKAVKDDPADFTGWTYLLGFVDNKNQIESGREAYTAFLKRYPYCYGYWKKFADLEKRNGSQEKAFEVLENGLKAIPLSVDLWLHFINHVKTSEAYKDDVDYLRAQFDRAVEACGREYRSDKIWDNFIKFELENNSPIKAYAVYGRALKVPTQGLTECFEKFRTFIKERHPKELMDTAEFLSLRKEVLADMKGDGDDEDKDDKEAKEKEDGGDAEKEPGQDLVPGEEGAEAAASDEETTAMKEKLIFTMKKTFKETETIFNTRYRFENQIKRPYFHVKPLERSQLKAWNDYLEHMKNNLAGKAKVQDTVEFKDVELIYERCLIACALYEEFWVSYANWLDSLEDDHVEQIRYVYSRACESHLPTKVDVHLKWAVFEEIQGNYEKASEILGNLEKSHPELTSVKLRRANLERRGGNDEKATLLYEACIKSTQDDALMADCSIKFSRYLRLHLQDTDKAKDVVNKAIEQNPKNVKLYLQMLDILLHSLPLDVPEIIKFFDNAIAQEFKASHRQLFSQRKVEFLEDFATDMQELKNAQEAHLKLSGELKKQIEQESDGWQDKGNDGRNISTLEGNRGGRDRNGGGPPPNNYPPIGNTPNYQAQHNMAYQQNSARYQNYPPQGYPPQGYPPYGGGGYGGGY